MLENQFYMRLMLLLAVGFVYVKAYMNMAKRNPKEIEPKRHIVLKILGGFSAFIAIANAIGGLYLITQITFPQEAIGPYNYSNTIIRSPYQTMHWGYATFQQSQCISMIAGVFIWLALSAYCFMFKSSYSKWYSKLWKVVYCILFCMFFVSATDFHYFDIYEWTAPVLFAIMAFFALKNKHKEIEIIPFQARERVENSSTIEDDSKYMPRVDTDKDNLKEDSQDVEDMSKPEIKVVEELSAKEQIDSSSVDEASIGKENINGQSTPEQANTELLLRFCRHCGKKIDYESDKFCKHCGKELI